jgi:neutral/alkaline ceramidase-like enzyme
MQVGLATVDFTPAVGLPLMGNFRDDYAARGSHDPLVAKAAVFADSNGAKAALLALDVCMVDRRNVGLIRNVVGSQCDVPPENVVVHATHTHSGPAPNSRFCFGFDFEPYRKPAEDFLTLAASAVATANENLTPARISIGRASEDRISFNRRLRRTDGSTQMNWEALAPGFEPDEIDAAWGPIDPEVICLVVEQDHRPVAAVVNFGLHPAILAGDNWLYSADYPGALAEAMRSIHGDHFTTLFFNGCCGNTNHVDYREPAQGRGFQQVQRVGHILAATASRAIRAAVPVATDRVAVSSRKVSLERVKIDEDLRGRCEKILEDQQNGPPKGQVDGLPDAYFAEMRLAMYKKQSQPDAVEVTAVRLGDVSLVGMPGEGFCELGIALKQDSPAHHTLVAGLTNDCVGYLPTEGSFAHGGYETTIGSTMYEPGAAESLVKSALSQLRELYD